MAMSKEKIEQAFTACRKLIAAEPKRFGTTLEHLAFMCDEATTYAGDRREKAMRWLGFVQGALWTLGLSTIDEMKEMNRPDGAGGDE